MLDCLTYVFSNLFPIRFPICFPICLPIRFQFVCQCVFQFVTSQENPYANLGAQRLTYMVNRLGTDGGIVRHACLLSDLRACWSYATIFRKGTLRSIITVDVAFRNSTELMSCDAAITAVYSSYLALSPSIPLGRSTHSNPSLTRSRHHFGG